MEELLKQLLDAVRYRYDMNNIPFDYFGEINRDMWEDFELAGGWSVSCTMHIEGYEKEVGGDYYTPPTRKGEVKTTILSAEFFNAEGDSVCEYHSEKTKKVKNTIIIKY